MRSSSKHLARIFRHATATALPAIATMACATALLAIAAIAPGTAAARSDGHRHGHRHRHGREARHQSRGHASRMLRASDRARLHEVSVSGATLYEVGHATGTLPGAMTVHMTVSARFTGTFTIHARGGSITGRGSAIAHGAGTIESFAGRLTVTGGSGRYTHARGHAGLYGTFNRNDYALSIKTTGTLHY